MDLNELYKRVYDLVSWIENHKIEVKGSGQWNEFVKRDSEKQETSYTMHWIIPWDEKCPGCGEIVESTESHYGSLGNGAHIVFRPDGTKYNVPEEHTIPYRLFGQKGLPGSGW